VDELLDIAEVHEDHLEVTVRGAPRLNVTLGEVGLGKPGEDRSCRRGVYPSMHTRRCCGANCCSPIADEAAGSYCISSPARRLLRRRPLQRSGAQYERGHRQAFGHLRRLLTRSLSARRSPRLQPAEDVFRGSPSFEIRVPS
jgi:hypothetical protein